MKDNSEVPADALTVNEFSVVVNPAPGHVCDRCRAVKEEVGTIEEAPEMCTRCYHIVKENFPEYFEQTEA